MKTKDDQKGITLIALVVTIVVLIILAGVSIAMLVGDNGIITQAQRAKENMQIATNEEQRQIANLEETLGESLEGIETEDKEIKLEDLKAGDYIEYDSGSNGKILCRVLYPVDSEYGVQILSDDIVKTVTLGGNNFEEARTSYNHAIETLNNEAEVYINATYATDARCVGSLPTVKDGLFVDKDKSTENTTILPDEYITPNEWTSKDTGLYSTDENYLIDQSQMQKLDLYIIEHSYYLASRQVDVYSSFCDFFVHRVYTEGIFNNNYVCRVLNTGDTDSSLYEHGLRPCILLKADIKIKGGDGKETSPYTLE